MSLDPDPLTVDPEPFDVLNPYHRGYVEGAMARNHLDIVTAFVWGVSAGMMIAAIVVLVAR
jgi:hypothetical protein